MEASFGAGAILVVVGIACLKVVQNRQQLAFASIPLVFGLQQFAEGMVWLSLSNPEYTHWQEPMTISFLVMAHIVWPLFIPASLFLLEKETSRKRILLFLFLTGTVLAVYFTWWLSRHHVNASANGHHIYYERDFPLQLKMFINLGYAVTAILPLFVSRFKNMWLLGLMFFLSFLAAKIFYTVYVISVWCFFAAVLSMIVFFILQKSAVSLKNKHLISH